MSSTRVARILAVCLALALFVVACDSTTPELSTTSTLLTSPGSAVGEPTTTTTTGSEPPVTAPPVGSTVSGYEIVARVPGDGGEVLFIVIPQAAYTDVDLENFIGDLIESGAATWGAEIFDDILALEAYQKAEVERTSEEQELIDQHHFLTLANGDTVRFQGPFESSGEFVIGS